MAETGADDDETLGAWALRYRGVATFGALAVLLGTGKFVGFHWHRLAFLRRFVVPPAVMSGLLGCVVYRLFKGVMSPGVKSSLDESLSEVGRARQLGAWAGNQVGGGGNACCDAADRVVLWGSGRTRAMFYKVFVAVSVSLSVRMLLADGGSTPVFVLPPPSVRPLSSAK